MYSAKTLERFKNPSFAGGLRGANATGRAEDEISKDLIKIYMLIDEDGIIDNAKFKAFGGVATIVACDIACQMLVGKSLEEALSITEEEIISEFNDIPLDRKYCATLVEEAIKNAVEDYYKRLEKLEKKMAESQN